MLNGIIFLFVRHSTIQQKESVPVGFWMQKTVLQIFKLGKFARLAKCTMARYLCISSFIIGSRIVHDIIIIIIIILTRCSAIIECYSECNHSIASLDFRHPDTLTTKPFNAQRLYFVAFNMCAQSHGKCIQLHIISFVWVYDSYSQISYRLYSGLSITCV